VGSRWLASEPEALVAFFRQSGVAVTRIGPEAGPLPRRPHAGLPAAGFEAAPPEPEARHVEAALPAMGVKTDRKDARGIAQLLRMGWFRPVHRQSPPPAPAPAPAPAREVRAPLVGRKLPQGKLRGVELGIR
jgi:hypothetical protein